MRQINSQELIGPAIFNNKVKDEIRIINNAKPEVKAKNLKKIIKFISSSFLKYKTRDQATSSIYIPFEE